MRYVIYILFLSLLGCESIPTESNSSQRKQNLIQQDKSKLVENNGVPFGDSLIITINPRWQYANYGESVKSLDTVSELIFQRLNRANFEPTDSNKITRNYSENNAYLDYTIPLTHAFDSTMSGQGV